MATYINGLRVFNAPGDSTVGGDQSIGGDLTVDGGIQLTGQLTSSGATVTINDAMTVTGDMNLVGRINSSAGDVRVLDDLTVFGAIKRDDDTPPTLADGVATTLPAGSTGTARIVAGDLDEYAWFVWDTSGAVTLVNNSANVVTTDAGVALRIFNNAGTVTIRNSLGAEKSILLDYSLTDSPTG